MNFFLGYVNGNAAMIDSSKSDAAQLSNLLLTTLSYSTICRDSSSRIISAGTSVFDLVPFFKPNFFFFFLDYDLLSSSVSVSLVSYSLLSAFITSNSIVFINCKCPTTLLLS